MAPVAGDDAGHRGADVVGIVASGHAPPEFGAVGELAEHLTGQPSQQVALVLEVDVEVGPRHPGLGGQPVHAELGEARTVAHQPLGGVEQPALDLLASLLPLGLRLAGHGRHGSQYDTLTRHSV